MKPYCCPVCNGSGLVSRPPHIAGDLNQWVDTGTAPYTCKACSGSGIVWGQEETYAPLIGWEKLGFKFEPDPYPKPNPINPTPFDPNNLMSSTKCRCLSPDNERPNVNIVLPYSCWVCPDCNMEWRIWLSGWGDNPTRKWVQYGPGKRQEESK